MYQGHPFEKMIFNKVLKWWQQHRQLDLLLFYTMLSFLYSIIGNAFPLWFGGSALVGTLLILMQRSKHNLILLDLLPALAIVQLWVAPAAWYVLEQSYSPEDLYYQMAVDPDLYFSITIPCVLALGIGSQIPLFFIKNTDQSVVVKIRQYVNRFFWLPWGLVLVGILAFFLGSTVSIGFRQVFHYLTQLSWVGALYLLFSDRHKVINGLLIAGVLLFWLKVALESTMFGHFVFWVFFGGLYMQLRLQWHLPRLVFLSGFGILLIFTLLSFKYQYRHLVNAAGGTTWERVLLLKQAFVNRLQQPLQLGRASGPLYRLNQGYYLSLVYAHVPAHHPFVKGETIYTAFKSALVPRLLWHHKPMTGGHESFPRFTGKALEENTSTNISPVGEAYVNFGARGAIFFLFFYSITLRLLLEGFRWLARRWYAPILLWLPLIYMTGVSVERDVLMVWNDAVKGSVFILCMCAILQVMNIKTITKLFPNTYLISEK